jgi:hypothetical protein
VPEPATIVTALLGLAAAGGYTLVRRKKHGGDGPADAE